MAKRKSRNVAMPQKASSSNATGSLMHFVAWFTGVVVSLVVGNAMIERTLGLPGWLGGSLQAGVYITMAIGWIVIATTLLGVILAILKR